ncbi:MAG: M48 family metallopeptidase [Candidatus Gastranaerophilales bacterium]|nr:M48 family metallopeptidase [Candidatus Gastranaerophilales bacterium]
MKKILLLFFVMFFGIQLSTQAADTTANATKWTTENGLARVKNIGTNILSKNNLPTQVSFTVVETDEINAFASGEKELCVYTGLLNYVNDDAELAGVIGHEIGHIVNNHVAKQSIFASLAQTAINNAKISDTAKTTANIANELVFLKVSRNDEYEADITGADLMVKAGYNPLAMVSVLYKISDNYFDFTSDHPSGDKRTMYLYDYLTYTYPDKVKAGYNSEAYTKFLAYATPIVEKRNANAKKLAKFNKEQAKLKVKREKKLKKYQNANNTAGWDASFSLLQSFAQAQ